jgi:hypothetical protein
VGLGHTNFGAIARDLRFYKAGKRAENEPVFVCYTLEPRESGRTTGSVPAHLGFTPVGVEELPPEISFDIIFY